MSSQESETWVVVVTTPRGDVLCVLGPEDSKIQAVAMGEVLRLGPNTATVCKVRAQDVCDVHRQVYA